MTLWQKLSAGYRTNTERLLWEGGCALTSASTVNSEQVPVGPVST